MGNSQSYDVTNVTSRDAKRQEKTGTVKPLRNDLPPQAAEVDEYLYRTEEPETLPVDGIPSQSRYD
ncbi:hypothetical protein OESDEN_17053 [Oesophagostomum dentatum]|uniref:Uncharacterized protein n=1 Tax=Oesophagostomum dentatum TaxID=61180 RepID=A0A0B1SJ71_OESDE|nr:hypothetical protein OESDEN_17053 [Oesophagostomum dentatum]